MKNFSLLFLIIAAFLPAADAAAYVDGTGAPYSPARCPGGTSGGVQTPISCSVGASHIAPNNDGSSNGVLPCGTMSDGNGDVVYINGIDTQIIPEACSEAIPGVCGQRTFVAGATYITPYPTGGPLEVGTELLNGIFQAINDVVVNIGSTIYTGIITSSDYNPALNALMAIYLAVYGAMITFGLAAVRPAEIISRLLKVALIYTLLGPTGWTYFDQYVATPVLGTMNDIITVFMSTASGAVGSLSAATPASETQLTPVSVITLTQPMDLIFSRAFSIVLLAHLFLGGFGWFFVLVLLWCAVEIFLMMVGAVITYVKSIVGLLFLFSLGPILIPFALFEQSKRVFYGWISLIFGFFLEPVMLFAFLGFFIYILNEQLLFTMYPNIGTPAATDFCWVKWFSFGPFDISWWRPVRFFALVNTDVNAGGGYPHGTWHGSTPTNFSDLLYLLFIIHIGKVVIKFIGHLAHDISGGQGPGIVRSADVGRWFSNNLFGGRRPGELAADFGRAALYTGQNAYDNLTGRRAGVGQTSYDTNQYAQQSADGTVYSDADGGAAPGTVRSGNVKKIDASVTAEQATERLNFIANETRVTPEQIRQLVRAIEGFGGNSVRAESELRDIAQRANVTIAHLKNLVHESGSL